MTKSNRAKNPGRKKRVSSRPGLVNKMFDGADEAQVRLFLDCNIVGLVLFDSDDRYVLWNRRYEELHTLGQTKITVGAKFEDSLLAGLKCGQYPEGHGREERWLSDRLLRHARPNNVEDQQQPGGRWVRIEERRTADGGVVGVHIDITDLKRRETSFKMMLEEHPLPMWLWDSETFCCLEVNNAAASHYGYTREHFAEITALDLLPAEDRDAKVQTARDLRFTAAYKSDNAPRQG